ncbi:MAG: hypothetical protein ACT4P7_17330 [Gemmatimonadaceae bacterium]
MLRRRSPTVPSPPCRSLGEYVRLLLRALARDDAAAYRRIGEIVGTRRAWLTLDDETYEVSMRDGRLSVRKPSTRHPHGRGRTSRLCTFDLLDGHAEVSEAVLAGALELVGSLDDVTRMSLAIEVLLDASARHPSLRRIAGDYRADPCREPPRAASLPSHAVTRVRLTASSSRELAMLRRLGLLP